MDAAWAVESRLTPDAMEFVRFCYQRRRMGWPEIYDEMCAVASRGLFRGWGPEQLAEHGVGFGLFELPALAALVARIVSEEPVPCRDRGRRRAVTSAEVRVQLAGPEGRPRSEDAATEDLRGVLPPRFAPAAS